VQDDIAKAMAANAKNFLHNFSFYSYKYDKKLENTVLISLNNEIRKLDIYFFDINLEYVKSQPI